MFWTKFVQKGHFRSETEKASLGIFELVYVRHFIFNK